MYRRFQLKNHGGKILFSFAPIGYPARQNEQATAD
jgi:hypothetical protein